MAGGGGRPLHYLPTFVCRISGATLERSVAAGGIRVGALA